MQPGVMAAEIAAAPDAEGQELGDLFEYKLKDRVTIAKNQSALVPILSAAVEAEKVTLWHEGQKYPLRALWLTNSSGSTLDSGTFNIVDAGAFAGEGVFEHIKPGEKRLLSYAADQGVRIETDEDSDNGPVTKVRAIRGVITISREEHEKKKYIIRNEDTAPRTVVIEHPKNEGWKITNNVKPEETSAKFYRFKVNADPKKTTEFSVEESEVNEQSVALYNVNSDMIDVYIKEKSISPAVEQALRGIVAQKNVIAGIDSQIALKNSEIQAISNDQTRLRENMKALKGSPEEKALLTRYTKQLNDQEDQLDALRKELPSLNRQRQEEQAKLNKMIQDLNIDEKM